MLFASSRRWGEADSLVSPEELMITCQRMFLLDEGVQKEEPKRFLILGLAGRGGKGVRKEWEAVPHGSSQFLVAPAGFNWKEELPPNILLTSFPAALT